MTSSINNEVGQVQVFHGDCLEVMDQLIAQGIVVDAIITDPPYGTTACSWDSVIPFDQMWERISKIIKPNGAIVIFGSEPFSSYLRTSNIRMYRYDWVWYKDRPTGMFLKDKHPMKYHESISVFSVKPHIYNPQMREGKENHSIGNSTVFTSSHYGSNSHVAKAKGNLKYPKSILQFKKQRPPIHPTQKPVDLIEYLVKTYTNEGDTVLDFTAGSGTTGVACLNIGRRCILIEKEQEYVDIIYSRLSQPL